MHKYLLISTYAEIVELPCVESQDLVRYMELMSCKFHPCNVLYPENSKNFSRTSKRPSSGFERIERTFKDFKRTLLWFQMIARTFQGLLKDSPLVFKG